jgi:hypothetical protein
VDLQSPAAAVAAHPSSVNLGAINLVKLPVCALSNCNGIGAKACSACFKESYCSGECQKSDWMSHKIMCKLIKQTPDELLPFDNVCLVVDKELDQTEDQTVIIGGLKYIRLLEHAAAFAEFQGKQFIKEGMAILSVLGMQRYIFWLIPTFSSVKELVLTIMEVLEKIAGQWQYTIT